MTTELSASPSIVVKDLFVNFVNRNSTVEAVKGLSFSVSPGEVLAIVGESGSGKSVSTMAIAGLLSPTAQISGSIHYRGVELLGQTDKQLSSLRGNKIGMIFQDPLTSLTPVYTIEKQIGEAIKIHNPDWNKAQIHNRVIELLRLVEIPDPEQRAKRFPHQFSGGMRQRVAIAMAIANNPEVIIADEPTTALDVTVQAEILNIIHRAKELTGAAVIFITHDMGVVAGIADRVLVMFRGKEVETGTVDEIFYHPQSPYTQGLLQAIPRVDQPRGTRLIPISAPEKLAAATLPPIHNGVDPQPGKHEIRLESSVVVAVSEIEYKAHDPSYIPAHAVPESITPVVEKNFGAPILEVYNLHKYYTVSPWEKFHAVQGVSFIIRERETFAIVGESGSGKTSTIMEIMQLHAPDEGSISLFGQDIARVTPKERKFLRRQLSIVFQDPMSSLDPRLPVGDLIGEPLKVVGIKGVEQKKRVRELLDQVGLAKSSIDRFPTQFSGGQRQRISIARALALHPKLLVLDEPVSALDVSIQASVLNLLHDLQNELGLAYLFVSHNLAVVKNMADEIGVMRDGAFVETGTVDAIFDNPRDPYTIALLAASPIPDPHIQRPRLEESARLVDAIS